MTDLKKDEPQSEIPSRPATTNGVPHETGKAMGDIPTPPYTAGQQIMNVSFNPDQRKDVAAIKSWCAEMYDWLDNHVINRFEGGRLKAISKTFLETFQMDAVQAVTLFDELYDFSKTNPGETNPTNGQLACSVNFNVGGREDVNFVKQESARMYDKMDLFFNAVRNFASKENRQGQTQEHVIQEHVIVANTPKNKYIEESKELFLLNKKVNICYTIINNDALSALRHFQKYAVKAITR